MDGIRDTLRRAFQDSPPLTLTALLMFCAFAIFLVGVAIDPWQICGVSRWWKPAKFGISTAIFSATIAWLLRYFTGRRQTAARVLGWVIALALVIEVVLIAMQAWRGTTSHFNVGTTFDALVFTVMGTTIGVLWTASLGIFLLTLWQPFQNPSWGWWIRMGLLTSVLGSAAGGLMVVPTEEQTTARLMGQTVRLQGGHTVGAADCGAGLPATGWSTEHGDRRIAHFFGLHGVQLLPLVGWFLMKRVGAGRVHTRLAFVAAASYIALGLTLGWQAARGQSVVAPDRATLIVLVAWLLMTLIAVSLAFTATPDRPSPLTPAR